MYIKVNIDSINSIVGVFIALTFAIYYFATYLFVKKIRLNLLLANFMFSFVVYLGGYSFYSSGSVPEFVLFWTRICYTGGLFVTYSIFLLSSELIHKKSIILNKFIIFFVIIFTILIFTPNEWLFTNILNPVKSHSSVIKGPLLRLLTW